MDDAYKIQLATLVQTHKEQSASLAGQSHMPRLVIFIGAAIAATLLFVQLTGDKNISPLVHLAIASVIGLGAVLWRRQRGAVMRARAATPEFVAWLHDAPGEVTDLFLTMDTHAVGGHSAMLTFPILNVVHRQGNKSKLFLPTHDGERAITLLKQTGVVCPQARVISKVLTPVGSASQYIDTAELSRRYKYSFAGVEYMASADQG